MRSACIILMIVEYWVSLCNLPFASPSIVTFIISLPINSVPNVFRTSIQLSRH
ncbi:hypothetical protein GYMLUDRAFT_205626, partial [Collybiopsis luxurians FD-317 M1]